MRQPIKRRHRRPPAPAAADASPDDLLDTLEAARLLHLAPRTLEFWRGRKSGPPCVIFSQRCVRYRRSSLLAFISARERANDGDLPPAAA